ncbi:IclR family transcriptional regulator C-terminal domain-containing protein [Nonomuraea sp. NPDC049784]|uniref:IclR family transcriptional regulator domain-containing protein n=1 Tax=Nonomuraea sp. NPDC049784 TaxID=3154361 RepID=UPI00340DA2B9
MEAAGTLERGLTVLRALVADPAGPMPAGGTAGEAHGAAPPRAGRSRSGRVRATDLVRATGLARSTVDRVLATLAHLGYVRAEGRDMLPAPPLMELGEAYLACGGLRDLLAPLAERLAEELDESVSLAVEDGDGVRFIGQFTRRRTMSVAFRAGDLLPAARCAAGLALLDPSAPWAEDDQLIEPGLIAVAVPVRDPEGKAVCAVSVVSHTSRHTAASLRDYALPQLRKTVADMEAALSEPAPLPRPDSAASHLARELPATEPPPRSGGHGHRAAKDELGAGFLQSLARGLAVLVSLGSARGGLSLADAAKATGLPRATARRSLQVLERLGYVTPHDSRFALLPKVMELGYASLSERTFGEVVQPHLADLVARVHQSASVGVLSGDDVLYVARVPTASIMTVNITVGTRFPAYATSMGRVLLADQPQERLAAIAPEPLTRHTITSPAELRAAVRQATEDGYALVDQELEEGVRSIAVPVRGRDGRVVAAVNVATHASRASRAGLLRDVLPALAETAARMAADLRHIPAEP